MSDLECGNRQHFAVELEDVTRETDTHRFVRLRLWVDSKPVGDFTRESLWGVILVQIRTFLDSVPDVDIPGDLTGLAPRAIAEWFRTRDAFFDMEAGSPTPEELVAWSALRRGTQFGVYSDGALSGWMVLILNVDGGQRVVCVDSGDVEVFDIVVPPSTVEDVLRETVRKAAELGWTTRIRRLGDGGQTR